MPGRDLSHPARSTDPSSRSAIITVSTESAMTSRETREKCIPSCPIEMPSETEMVPNSRGKPPPACTPFFTAFANRSSERLQGVISFQLDATPICGLAKSSSPMPTARSMPRAAALSRPSVTSRLRGLMSGESGAWDWSGMPGCYAEGSTTVPNRLMAVPTVQRWAGSVDDGGADAEDVGEVLGERLPGVALVVAPEHGAVAAAEVDTGRGGVVDAHGVTHHPGEEAVGEAVAQLLPGVATVAGTPDSAGALDREASVGALEREDPDRPGRVRVRHDR